MTGNHAELFNTFLEAGKAMEELPKVKDDLQAAEQLIDKLNEDLTTKDSINHALDAEIARLKADLATREAELASATFRAEQGQKALATIRGYLDFNTDRVGDNVALVGQPQAVATYTRDLVEPVTSAAEGGSKPNVEEELLAGLEKMVGATSAPLPSADSQATTYGVVSEGQFVSHDPLDDAMNQATDERIGAYPESLPSDSEPMSDPKPYLGRPHWQKPSTITWGEWQTKGGEVPHWYSKEFDELSF